MADWGAQEQARILWLSLFAARYKQAKGIFLLLARFHRFDQSLILFFHEDLKERVREFVLKGNLLFERIDVILLVNHLLLSLGEYLHEFLGFLHIQALLALSFGKHIEQGCSQGGFIELLRVASEFPGYLLFEAFDVGFDDSIIGGCHLDNILIPNGMN